MATAVASATTRVLRYIPAGDLKIDPRYQRSPHHEQVTKIKRNFNDKFFGCLMVSARQDGSQMAIDGQHRLIAVRELFGPDYPVACLVHLDLTYEDEVSIFNAMNGDRKHLKHIVIFNNKLQIGDADATAIVAILDECGFRLTKKAKATATNEIKAVRLVEKLYRVGGADGLKEVLTLVQEAWPDEQGRNKSDIFLGLHTFLSAYRDHEGLSRERLVKQLASESIFKLRREARENGEKYRIRRETGFAWAVLDAYNFWLKANRLPNLLVKEG